MKNKNSKEIKKEQKNKTQLKEYHSPELKSLGTISVVTQSNSSPGTPGLLDGPFNYS